MPETLLNKTGNDFLGPPCVHGTRSKLVSTSDDLAPGDGAESNSLAVTWFEPHCRTSRDVQSLPVGPGPIEGQTGVGFDEVVVRSNL